MERPSIDRLIEVMLSKNYRVYDTPSVDWNLNIVGIRSSNRSPIRFDDLLIVFHRFMGEWDAAFYSITTDPSPGRLSRRRQLNRAGTAILMEGQYRSVYQIDVHRRGKRGGHKALCQRLGNVTVYRDNNRDETLDIDPSTIQSGKFGINIHRGPRGGIIDPVNWNYSAGCQVFADDRHFAECMLKCEYGKEAFGNSFTYTLLLENDFIVS